MRLRTVSALVLSVSLLAACGDSAGDAPKDSSADTEAPSTDAPSTDAPADTEAPPAEAYPEKPTVEVPAQAPTELVVTVLIEGEGPEAVAGDTVIVDYVGVLISDGSEFDASYNSQQPFPVPLGAGGVIQGWDDGLLGAQAGSRIQLDIPADLAYGEAGSPPAIGPNEALTFVIDVRTLVPGTDPADAPLDLTPPSTEGVTELTVEDLVVGEGDPVGYGDEAYIHYLAFDSEGNLLQNSWEAPQPQALPLEEGGPSLTGLVDSIVGMQPGGRRSMVIPAELAFGDEGNAQLGIDPGETFVIIVDLIAIG
jgi:peptidylprolyl isomerase